MCHWSTRVRKHFGRTVNDSLVGLLGEHSSLGGKVGIWALFQNISSLSWWEEDVTRCQTVAAYLRMECIIALYVPMSDSIGNFNSTQLWFSRL